MKERHPYQAGELEYLSPNMKLVFSELTSATKVTFSPIVKFLDFLIGDFAKKYIEQKIETLAGEIFE